MPSAHYSEPFAIQETFVEDIEIERRDGIVYLTYLRTISNEAVAVGRIIMSDASFESIGRKARAFIHPEWVNENRSKVLS